MGAFDLGRQSAQCSLGLVGVLGSPGPVELPVDPGVIGFRHEVDDIPPLVLSAPLDKSSIAPLVGDGMEDRLAAVDDEEDAQDYADIGIILGMPTCVAVIDSR